MQNNRPDVKVLAMKRLTFVLVALLLAMIALPPLWFSIFPGDPAPDLPPAGRRVVLADGTGLNVLDSGHGPAILMLHGLPGSAYDWRETSEKLVALGLRSIRVDRVGYGRSDPRASGPYTTESNAAELIELLEAMDLRDVTVVGWSYGGATAMTAAMKQPERLRRLVLIGTGGPDSDDAQPPEVSGAMRVFYSDPVLRWRASIPPLSVALMKVLSNEAFSGGPQPTWWLEGLRANFSRPETVVTFREEMFGMTADSVAEFDLSRIRVPTLLLHGDDDRLAPVGISRYLVSRLDGARLVEYPGASHMLPVTHAEAIAKEIVAFTHIAQ